jgi:hypothetical protein
MTMKGSINYVKAIELYEKDKKAGNIVAKAKE